MSDTIIFCLGQRVENMKRNLLLLLLLLLSLLLLLLLKVDEKYRKVFVTAHVILRTHVRVAPSQRPKQRNSLPEILKKDTDTGEMLLFNAWAKKMAPMTNI